MECLGDYAMTAKLKSAPSLFEAGLRSHVWNANSNSFEISKLHKKFIRDFENSIHPGYNEKYCNTAATRFKGATDDKGARMCPLRLWFGLLPCVTVTTPIGSERLTPDKAAPFVSYFTGSRANVLRIGLLIGGICMMGGRSERDEAMHWFLEQVKGGDYFFSDLGVEVNSVETLAIDNDDAALRPYVI
jgi:hypothetical protein